MAAIQNSRSKQALILATVVFFCLPLGRFYLLLESDPIQCLEQEHSHVALASGGHHHGPTLTHSPAEKDSGFFFQHCKDTYDGMGLTPAQPLGVPVSFPYHFRGPSSTIRLLERYRLPEGYAPILFHPPRHRA